MRIYAVADIHGRQKRLSIIRMNTQRFLPDVIVVAGDITNFLQADKVIRELASLSIPVLAVRGNTDLPHVNDHFRQFPTVFGLHLNSKNVGDSVFVGIDGTIPVPFRTRLAIREVKLMSSVRSLLDRNTIFVAHPPPLGTLDLAFGRFHVGSRCVAQIVRDSQPLLLICGHIHEHSGTAQLGKTLVVNASMNRKSAGAMIDLEADKSLHVEILGTDSDILP